MTGSVEDDGEALLAVDVMVEAALGTGRRNVGATARRARAPDSDVLSTQCPKPILSENELTCETLYSTASRAAES